MRWRSNLSHIWLIGLVGLPLFLLGCENDLLGDDLRLFYEVRRLAEAVAEQDISEIEIKLNEQPSLVNYREPRFGHSLLIWSIQNDRYRSAETLLRLGAHPNLPTYDGTTAVTYAAEWQSMPWKGDPKYLNLVLAHGGDPNSTAPNSRLQTPLIAAVHSLSIKNLEALIKHGADPNYANGCESALNNAFYLNQINLVRYLIIDVGVDVTPRGCKTLAGDDISILSRLRRMVYPIGSPEHRMKMEVVLYLRKYGMDYSKEPIPDNLEGLYDEDYLKKY